jgi:hypothetical protein
LNSSVTSVFGAERRAHVLGLGDADAAADQELVVEPVADAGAGEGDGLEQVALAAAVLADEHVDAAELQRDVAERFKIADA